MENNENNENNYEINILEILQLLRKNLIKIIISGILVAVLAATYTVCLIAPTYQSVAKMVILNKNEINITYNDLQVSTQLVEDSVVIIKSREILEGVISELELPMTAGQLASKLSIQSPQDTRIIMVTVTDTDPVRAQMIAYKMYELSSEILLSTLDVDGVNLFEQPAVPTGKFAPNTKRNTLFGGMIGALLMAAIVVVKRLVNNKVNTVEDVEQVLGLTVLAAIPLNETTESPINPLKKHRRHHRHHKKEAEKNAED